MKKQPEWINATQAREILGVARATFARLLREGVLSYESNPLNKREKLLDRREVIRLRDRYKRGAE